MKPGGVLVYSTCTTEVEENRDVVKDFVAKHAEFSVESAQQYIKPQLVNSEGYVETFPHKHGMDGSFAIRMRRGSLS